MRRPSATLIGIFVLGAIALTVAAILFFGSGALFKDRVDAVSYFHGSVAGLQTGASVTYRGVRVGEVKSIAIRLDPDPKRSIVEVRMEIVPEAANVHGPEILLQNNPIPALVQHGLSARLVMQSFVTGLLQVELDFRRDMQPQWLGATADAPEIPTVPSPFQALAEQLQTLDVARIAASFSRSLDSIDATLNNAGLKQTLDGLPLLLADLRHTVKTIDVEVNRFSATGQRAANETAAGLQTTLVSVQKLANNLDRETASTLALARDTIRNAGTAIDGANALLDPQGRTILQVQDAVDDLAVTSARLRDLAERVDRDPTILIRGRAR